MTLREENPGYFDACPSSLQPGHGHGRRWRRPRGTLPPSGLRSQSAAEAQAGFVVEQMHVLAFGRQEVDDGALLRRGATVDAHDDRLDLACGLGGRAVDVGVGPELFDDVDGDRQAVTLYPYREVLGTDTEGDLLADVGQDVALDGVVDEPNFTPPSTIGTSKRFIAGEPMNPATNTLFGWSYMPRGVSHCCRTPSLRTATRSPIVMASIWSWVT